MKNEEKKLKIKKKPNNEKPNLYKVTLRSLSKISKHLLGHYEFFFLIFHLAFPRRLRPEVWPLLRRPLRNNTSENRLNEVKILPNPNFDP
jgi:hypothetical protein